MTVDPVLMNVFMTVMTILVVGIAGKLVMNYLQSGRVKTKEIYRTVDDCDDCRQHCCVNVLKTQFADHVKSEAGNDATVKEGLANIKEDIRDMKKGAEKTQAEVSGIRSALDKMAGLFEGYVQRSDERDRRTDEIGSQQ